MSRKILEALAQDIAEYTESKANSRFRNKAKFEEHIFKVSASKIRASITTAVNDALVKAGTKLDKNQESKLDTIISNATITTINNIKTYFNYPDATAMEDLEIVVSQVTGIDALKGAFNPEEKKYDIKFETIYDNIRNSFNNLKRPLAEEIRETLEVKIDQIRLVVGHEVSVIERRSALSAKGIKTTIDGFNNGKEKLTWRKFLNLFSNEDRVILSKLASGPTQFTWIVEIEDGISNNPNKKLIETLGITEARLQEVYSQILAKAQERLKKKLPNSKGSDSLPTVIKKIVLQTVEKSTKKDKRVKVKVGDTKIDYPDGKPVKAKTKKYNPKKSKTKRTNVNAPSMSLDEIQGPTSTINLGALKAQINARLSMTVIKNMGFPALENRTGRFARSVEVTDVVQTREGYPSIGYTYQKYPYQTFEPGYKQGSAQRDPRTLIDRSIREIAQQLIVGRFYTRRV